MQQTQTERPVSPPTTTATTTGPPYVVLGENKSRIFLKQKDQDEKKKGSAVWDQPVCMYGGFVYVEGHTIDKS